MDSCDDQLNIDNELFPELPRFRTVETQTDKNPRRALVSYKECLKCDQFQFFTGLSAEDFEVLFELLGGNKVVSKLKYKYGASTPKKGGYGSFNCRDRLFMFLVRLRRGVPLADMSYVFHISEGYLSDILYVMTRHIYLTFKSMEEYTFISASDQGKKKLKPFKSFKNLRIILDGAEFFIQKPTNFVQQGNTYSTYKATNTIIFVVGISCYGGTMFVSPGYEGNMSDKQVVLKSGLLERLQNGDVVMTDRGFEIVSELQEIGVGLLKPPVLGDRDSLTAEEEILTKAIASARIYVEHAIADIKDNRLLQGVIPITLAPVLPDLVYIAGLLRNFNPSRIRGGMRNCGERDVEFD